MNFSGNGNNKVFKVSGDPAAPYYYLSGTLNLAGAVENGTYYFNLDNSLEYADNRDYNRYIMVDENALISEVIVFSDEDIVPVDGEEGALDFLIGGADKMNALDPAVVVPWAAPAGSAPVAPPGFVGDYVSWEEVNAGTVNYYGHEGGHFPYFNNGTGPDLSKRYKYLAVTVKKDRSLPEPEHLGKGLRQKKRVYRGLPDGDAVVAEGKISVILKIYPKSQ